MRLALRSCIAILALAGCGPSFDELDAKNRLAPADFCRWREKHGMGISRKCLMIEQAEREERRDSNDRQDREQASARSFSRRIDAKLAEIRANPKYPELGATSAEAKNICTAERGQWVDKDTTIGCKVGGSVVFACNVGDQSTLIRCTRWLEGAELAETRKSLAEDHGQPTSQNVVSGYRVFTWADGTELTGDARGVKITESQKVVTAPQKPDDLL